MTGFNQPKQSVNKQININIQGHESKDPNILLEQGIKHLQAKSYQLAIDLLKEAVKIDSSLANAYYCLALALLKGKRPKVLQRKEIEEIDEHLCSSAVMGDSDGTVQWFRALVRDDYYRGNRLTSPSPSVGEIVSSIQTTNIERLQELLKNLPMSDNQLYRELVKQIF